MSELVYRRPCEHGYVRGECGRYMPDVFVAVFCPGGVEIVLDPERVLVDEDPGYGQSGGTYLQVQDILDVLDEETE